MGLIARLALLRKGLTITKLTIKKTVILPHFYLGGLMAKRQRVLLFFVGSYGR